MKAVKSNIKFEKENRQTPTLIQFQLFIFYKPAWLQKHFHGRLHPGIFLGRALWADSVSPQMKAPARLSI